MKIGFRDTEGRRRRADGKRVLYVWPFTDFDGYRVDLATTLRLARKWYVSRPLKWSRWYVGDAWDPHGERRWNMSSAPHPAWWRWILWPVAALGRWLHRNCPRCVEDDDEDLEGAHP